MKWLHKRTPVQKLLIWVLERVEKGCGLWSLYTTKGLAPLPTKTSKCLSAQMSASFSIEYFSSCELKPFSLACMSIVPAPILPASTNSLQDWTICWAAGTEHNSDWIQTQNLSDTEGTSQIESLEWVEQWVEQLLSAKLLQNPWYYPTIPRKWERSFLVCVVFFVNCENLSANCAYLTMASYLTKANCFCPGNSLRLMVRWAQAKWTNRACMWLRWFSRVSPKITGSSKYTAYPARPDTTLFIRCWKVARGLHNQNSITVYEYSPVGVIKEAISIVLGV